MTLTQAWSAAIDEWLVSLRAAGQADTTLRIRRQHISQFARNGGHADPYAVTGDDLIAWFGANTWAAETRHAHMGSHRSFYGWAHHKSFVRNDPALELPKVPAHFHRVRGLSRTIRQRSRWATPTSARP
jgi:hypothetical protein